MPPCHSDDWFRDDPVTLKFRTFVQFLREEWPVFPWIWTKKHVAWLLLLAVLWTHRRPTWGWSWQMEEAKEAQRNGTIFLIIPCLKSALPTDLSVKWPNKLHLLFKPSWVEFYIACTRKHSNLHFLRSPFREGMSPFLVIWGTKLEGSIFVSKYEKKVTCGCWTTKRVNSGGCLASKSSSCLGDLHPPVSLGGRQGSTSYYGNWRRSETFFPCPPGSKGWVLCSWPWI